MSCEHEELIKDHDEKTIWYCPACGCNFVITKVEETKYGRFKSWLDDYLGSIPGSIEAQ